jgi:hypothetical protein
MVPFWHTDYPISFREEGKRDIKRIILGFITDHKESSPEGELESAWAQCAQGFEFVPKD